MAADSGVNEQEFHWLTGILEGEGTFLAGPPSSPNTCAVRVEMTDRDVIAHIAGLLRRAIVGLPPRRSGCKPSFLTTMKGAPAVALMHSIRPFLSVTRQAQVDRVITRRRGDLRQRRGAETVSLPHLDPATCDGECDLAWLAGLLEGEGTFGTSRQRTLAYPLVSVEMTEESVVRRAAKILGATAVRRVESRKRGWRPTFVARVAGHTAAAWMQRVHALMGERRRAAIETALASYAPIRIIKAPAFCVVSGCGEPHRSRGLCHKHYMMWMRDLKRGREERVRALR